MSNRRNGRAPNQHGNMLGMTALIGGILLFAAIVALCYYMFFAEHNRAQSQSDREAVELAKLLNEGDRVGQINNIVARNRELVFVSRLAANQTQQKLFQIWQPLAQYLLDGARASTSLVESERKNQIAMAKRNIRFACEHYNLFTKSETALKLPFWHSWEAQIAEASLGSVSRVPSNVVNTEVFSDLRDFDKQKNYFQPGSNLYLGNINAKLPAPDDDLDFKIASLAAPVENSVAPSRLIDIDAFKLAGTIFEEQKTIDREIEHVPSAVGILQGMRVSAMASDQQMKLGACACSNGAEPPPFSAARGADKNARPEKPAIYSEAWLDQRYDWTAHLEPTELKGYVDYQGSRLKPITNVKISVRLQPRLEETHQDKFFDYEDLWYHEGQPIGCRRYNDLKLKSGWQGAICLPADDNAYANSAAMANAVIRLLLDAGVKNCSVTVVLVPQTMTARICNDLGKFNFFRTQDDALDSPSAVHLLVSSGNPQDRTFLVYELGH